MPLKPYDDKEKGKNSGLGGGGRSDRETIKQLGDLGSVIGLEKIISRKEEDLFRTRLHLSSWTVTLMDIIMNKYSLTSERKMYQATLSLGTVFIEDDLKELIAKQREMRAEILLDKNPIKAFLATRHSPISIGGDPVLNGQKVVISMPSWVKDSLGSIAQFSGIQVSSLRRMAIYMAFNTVDAGETYKKDIDYAVDVFKRNITYISDIYDELREK